MPRYDFRCRRCGETFEVSRAINQADAPATCPSGHDDTTKLLSMVALGGSTASGVASAPAGGCCGGACGCG